MPTAFPAAPADAVIPLLDRLTQVACPPLEALAVIVLCTSFVYLFMVVFLQFSRRSALGHASVFDLVLMLVLANAVQNAMVAGDNSLAGGITSALTLFFWDGLLGFVRRRVPRARRFLGGERIRIVQDGRLLAEPLEREGLHPDDLPPLLEQHGLGGLAEVEAAYLEIDGSVTFVPRQGAPVKRRSQLHAPRHGRR